MAEVVLDNVTKIFPGGVEAVKDFDLHIQDQEFIVLVGPSGCGKSTTLRMVAGLEEITRGTIRIGDRVVNDVPPKDRDIAMVFQNYALYPHMTVFKNMAFSLKLRRYPKKEIAEEVEKAARILGITELLERRPKALSGGQRQRVAVGRAIVRNPKAFLFDEPLSNLDAKLRVEMRAELKYLQQQLKTTTIYVTHDQEEAMTLGDRVVVMKEGQVKQCGTALETYDKPVNRFVAGFVGTPPMNFVDGRLVAEDGAVAFDEGTTRLRLLPEYARVLSAWIGKEVTMGIRPEALFTRQSEQFGAGNVLSVRINVVEPLGADMDLYVTTPSTPRIVARIDAQRALRPGQEIELHVDMSKIHVFERGEDGRNLSLAAISD